MRFLIIYDIIYCYEDWVCVSIQYLCLILQDSECQYVVDWCLDLLCLVWLLCDLYGNILYVLILDELYELVLIVVYGLVEIDEECEVEYDCQLLLLFLCSICLIGVDVEMCVFVECVMGGCKDCGGLFDLMYVLYEYIFYQLGVICVDSIVIEVFGVCVGVCQDYVYVFFVCVCSQGVLGCYVFGYFYIEDDMYLVSYVWVEVWFGDGWYSFDVINWFGCLECYFKLVVGFDYLDVCLVCGLCCGGGCEQMYVRVLVSVLLLQVQ